MNKVLLIIGVIILMAGVGIGGPKVISTIRGIRNNNPLNIRRGDDWDGLSPEQNDDSFCQFTDVVYGVRAGAKILQSYAKSGVNTLEKIVNAWAPVTENDTEAYIKHVMSETGFDRNHVIKKDSGDYVPLLAAMIKHENGFNPYSLTTIAQGVALA